MSAQLWTPEVLIGTRLVRRFIWTICPPLCPLASSADFHQSPDLLVMFKAVRLIAKPFTFSRGSLLVRSKGKISTLFHCDHFSASISSACHSSWDPVIARKSLIPIITNGHSASTFLATSGRLCGINLHSPMARKPVIDSGNFIQVFAQLACS